MKQVLPLPCHTLEGMLDILSGDIEGWSHLHTMKSAPPILWVSVRMRDSLAERNVTALFHTLFIFFLRKWQTNLFNTWYLEINEHFRKRFSQILETWKGICDPFYFSSGKYLTKVRKYSTILCIWNWLDYEIRAFHVKTEQNWPFLLVLYFFSRNCVVSKDGIPVLRLDQRVTDMRNGQVLLQVLVLLTGLIMAPH